MRIISNPSWVDAHCEGQPIRLENRLGWPVSPTGGLKFDSKGPRSLTDRACFGHWLIVQAARGRADKTVDP